MEVWSGIDVSKSFFDASWVDPEAGLENFQKIPHAQFEHSQAGVRQYVRWLQQQGGSTASVRVVMEATGRYSLELQVWLVAEQASLSPAIVNPKQAKHFHQSLGLRNKTDQVDCRSLGLMGQARRPHPYEPLSPEYQRLRALMRQRRDLITTRVGEQQRLRELPKGRCPVRSVVQSHLRHLTKLVGRIDRAIDGLLKGSPQLAQDLALLKTIPGVGRIVALTVLAELGDLRRFNRSRQVSAMAGISPYNHQSGVSTPWSHLDRNGHAEARSVLYMGALAATRGSAQNNLARTYHHLIDDNDKCKKQALVAVGRKILVIMRALLITQQPYIDDFATTAS
ncbi:MAG: transposase [Syntrophobacteria bacterium]